MAGPDRRSVARAFAKAADTYTAADFLHGEIRAGIVERLDLVQLAPAVVLDLGAGPPAATAEILTRFPAAQGLAVDVTPTMLGVEPQRWARVCADAGRLPLPDASVDLVVASMLLPWCSDPAGVLAEIRRVLRFPGLLAFATLGPDSLRELRASWPQPDSAAHTLYFADMHNLGDALVRAGFAEPVVDAHALTVSYRALERGIADLRAVGAANLNPARRLSLTGRGRWQAMTGAYETRRTKDGVLPVTLEILYGLAWSGESAQRFVAPGGEIDFPVSRLRRR